MSWITIKATDGTGTFGAYLVEPKHKPAGAVVLIQEIFGINASMRDTADQFAELGFLVLAPDLFWRQEAGVQLTDKSKEEWDRAFKLMHGFNQDKGVEDLKAALAEARKLPGGNGRAGTVGYCLGGRLAFMMAEHSDADVNVSYYGVGLDSLLPGIGAISKPLIVHIADNDAYFPAEARAEVVTKTKANPHVKTYTYPGADHAFARIGGIHWDARSAWMANGRSVEALVAALG
jgi:carboxymethylenebutenolidase